MTKNKADIILEEAGQSFELSLLGYPKSSKIIEKIKNSQYNSVRRLAMIRLYLCDSIDGNNCTIKDEILKGSEVFVQVGKEEIKSITNLGIKDKDVINLINKAFLIYFGDSSVQYSFDFNQYNIKEYLLANDFLTARMKNRQYFEGDIRGYVYPQELINVMMYLVEKCKFPNLIKEFQDFIKLHTESDSLINEKDVKYFYGYLNSLIQEEYNSFNIINKTKDNVSDTINSIIKN